MNLEIPYNCGKLSALFPDNPPIGAISRNEFAKPFGKIFNDLPEETKDAYRKEFDKGYKYGETVRKSHAKRRIDARLGELHNQLNWFEVNEKTDDPEFERLSQIKKDLEEKMLDKV
jgi:hypothetical protein